MHFLTDLIVFKILIIWLITFWAFKEFPSISVRPHGIFKISVCFFSVDILLNIWNVVLINCNFGWWCQFTIINFDTGQNSIMIFPNSFNYGFVKLYACIIRGFDKGVHTRVLYGMRHVLWVKGWSLCHLEHHLHVFHLG